MVKGGVPKSIDLSEPEERERVLALLELVDATSEASWDLMSVLRRFPRPHGTYAKSQLLGAYRALLEEGALKRSPVIERRLRGRPVRTISGVSPVAVLTEPYACPGECIFCPDQVQAPKSYLDGEPGVLRAIQNDYDPYRQTRARIEALNAIGHPTDKIELLILGGTWSAYPLGYRESFLRRCFDAMNERAATSLREAQTFNETAAHRNVGIAIETRPDCITPEGVMQLRRQGITKVQLGVQSLDDHILDLNRRGHNVADSRHAFRLLRLAGFKIVMHWMPNLLGASPSSDEEDFSRIFSDPAIRPDELKVYPTALLEGTELYGRWESGAYRPYDETTLIELLVACKQRAAPYCRINRVMRDIPSDYIVEGTKKSNLRQIIQATMAKRGMACQCIRCREIRGRAAVNLDATTLDVVAYDTNGTRERFLQYLTPNGKLVGFLRLSLPKKPRDEIPLSSIRTTAMVREVHVYGPAQGLGQRRRGAQHRGIGTQLLEKAAEIAHAAGFDALSVIAAVGTRVYYRERGFTEGDLYPTRRLP